MQCQCCDAPTASGALCGNCASELDDTLEAIPGLLDELDITISRQARMVESIGRKGAETPMPYHHAAALAYRKLSDEVYRVARRFALTPAGVNIIRNGGVRACAIYLRRIEVIIVNHPEAGEILSALHRRTSKARQVIDKSAVAWYAGICSHDDCDADLYAPEGAATVTCRKCRTVHDVAARREVLTRALDDVLVTATEIGRAVHITGEAVKPARVWQWRRRGKIITRGTNAKGEPLYRLGDVLALLRPDQST